MSSKAESDRTEISGAPRARVPYGGERPRIRKRTPITTCQVCGGPTVSTTGICKLTPECRRQRINIAQRKYRHRDQIGPDGGVYVIGMDEVCYVKIGYTKMRPQNRLSIAQSMSPFRLFLLAEYPGDRKLEKRLHRRFAKFCIRGEWFDLGEHAKALRLIEREVERYVAR